MGFADAVGYEVRPVNAAQRLAQKGAATRPGAWLFSKVLHHADRRLFALTKGRLTVPGLVAGLPILMITTTGAKSGEARTMPLMGIPVGDDLAVIGTNFGQSNTPGWVYNLEADPVGQVSYRDRLVDFVARRANAEETGTTLSAAAQVYPGYDKYRERISGREVKVFVLENRPGPH
jgi:deazaflavin-dependent oxidoreductase (nitroreductase family)